MFTKRSTKKINAGSTADIAFLLLVFFLIATTMNVDKGLMVKLPPPVEIDVPIEINERNVLEVLVNAHDQLLVEGKLTDIGELKEITIEFITNPNNSASLPDSPLKAVISLQNDRATTYQAYIDVQNELRAAYNQVRNHYALTHFDRPFDHLNKVQQAGIRKLFPIKISEAEPADYAIH